MTKPKLGDFNLDPEKLRRYEADFETGKFKSEGEEDHQRLMELVKEVNKTKTNTPAPEFSPPSPAPSKAGLKLPALFSKFLLLRGPKITVSTQKSYAKDIEQFSNFIKNPNIADITVDDVLEWARQNGHHGLVFF